MATMSSTAQSPSLSLPSESEKHDKNCVTDRPVTIVIPVRNRGAIVGRTLSSLSSQTYRPLDIVLVDNGSTDNTLEVLERWATKVDSPDFRVRVVSEPRRGAAVARNRGLCEVTTPYVMFFDSDDVMTDRHVERVIKAIKSHPDARLLYWDVAIIDADGWMKIKSRDGSDLMRSHIYHATLSTQRYVADTGLVRSVGGWDEKLAQWDDLELGLRLLLAEGVEETSIYVTGEPTVQVFPQDDSLSGKDYSGIAVNLERTLDTMASDVDHLVEDATERDVLQLMIDMRRADLAGHLAREGNRDEARRIMSEILAAAPTAKDALIMRMAYTTVKYAGRGAYLFTSMLSRKRRPRTNDAADTPVAENQFPI